MPRLFRFGRCRRGELGRGLTSCFFFYSTSMQNVQSVNGNISWATWLLPRRKYCVLNKKKKKLNIEESYIHCCLSVHVKYNRKTMCNSTWDSAASKSFVGSAVKSSSHGAVAWAEHSSKSQSPFSRSDRHSHANVDLPYCRLDFTTPSRRFSIAIWNAANSLFGITEQIERR